MDDLTIPVPQGAASVALIGRVLGRAGISLEGGGVWADIAHYLVHDGHAAVRALADAGMDGARSTEAVVVPLTADVPGELGRMITRLADAGVRLDAQYSDHDNRKVFVVDDPEAARAALA